MGCDAMNNVYVNPKELYAMVEEFNRKQFILRKALKESNYILVRHYRREVDMLRNLALKRFNIILD